MLGKVLEELTLVQHSSAFKVGTAGAQGPVNGHMLAWDRMWFLCEGHALSLCPEFIFGLGTVGGVFPLKSGQDWAPSLPSIPLSMSSH